MALIVEDGTGVLNAEALVSVAFVDDYATRYGKLGWAALSEAAKEINIRNATQFAISKFPFNTRPLYEYQSYPFPAYQYSYRGSFLTGIPIQLERAVAELAIIAITTPLTSNAEGRDYIYRRTNISGIEKEIRWATPQSGSQRTFDTVEMILAPLLGSVNGGLSVKRMRLGMTTEEEANADVVEILAEEGRVFDVSRPDPTARTLNATTLRPEEGPPYLYQCLGVFYDPSASAIKSGWEEATGADARVDLKYIIIKPRGTDEPKPGDIFQALNLQSVPEGRPVIAMLVNAVGPYGAPIFYRVAAE